MASQKQIEANRKNALKSTGAKTEEGKAVVRLNALTHGMTAETAVIPFVENPADWEAHREGVLDSLSPIGHLETVLTERIASILWRLGRANRYEREVVALEQERMEEKYVERKDKSLNDLRETIKENRRLRRLVEKLPSMKAKEPLPKEDAADIFWEAANKTENVDVDAFVVPGIPEDAALEEYEGWTVGILKESLKKLADEEQLTYDELIEKTMFGYTIEEAKAKVELQKAETEIERKRRTRLLPDAHLVDSLSRYEAHLERSLYKAMHEIQRLQASRKGQNVLPLVAVDVTVDAS